MKKFEYLEHPADLKVRAFGKTLAELFINAAQALTNFLYEVKEAQIIKTEIIEISADNLENLLMNWLAEILYLSDANHLACVDFKITSMDEKKIMAEVGMTKALPKDDIKAITYSELSVKKVDGGWEAVFVCDI
jgi:SHS2 domain-containing protein